MCSAAYFQKTVWGEKKAHTLTQLWFRLWFRVMSAQHCADSWLGYIMCCIVGSKLIPSVLESGSQTEVLFLLKLMYVRLQWYFNTQTLNTDITVFSQYNFFLYIVFFFWTWKLKKKNMLYACKSTCYSKVCYMNYLLCQPKTKERNYQNSGILH